MPASGSPAEPVNGWVLYDGDCGFCSRWLQFWQRTLAKHGFHSVPLQEPWVAERLKVPADQLLYDIRLLTRDGELASGADVYLQVTRRIWWARPFFTVFSLPGFNWLIHTAIDGSPETATAFRVPVNWIRLHAIVSHAAKINC